jgi:hypothetical protein
MSKTPKYDRLREMREERYQATRPKKERDQWPKNPQSKKPTPKKSPTSK